MEGGREFSTSLSKIDLSPTNSPPPSPTPPFHPLPLMTDSTSGRASFRHLLPLPLVTACHPIFVLLHFSVPFFVCLFCVFCFLLSYQTSSSKPSLNSYTHTHSCLVSRLVDPFALKSGYLISKLKLCHYPQIHSTPVNTWANVFV